MDLETAKAEIQAANGDASKISADALSFFSGLELPSTDGLIPQDKANALAASARKKAEAQAADAAAKLAEMQEQFDELSDAKSGKPDLQKQLDKLQAKLKAAQDDAEAAKAEAVSTKRGMALKDIAGKIGFAEGVSDSMRNAMLNAATSSLDLDDLFDDNSVSSLVSEFREANAAIVAGSASAGAGSTPGGAAAKSGPKQVSISELNNLATSDPSKHQEMMPSVWAGVQDKSITLVA